MSVPDMKNSISSGWAAMAKAVFMGVCIRLYLPGLQIDCQVCKRQPVLLFAAGICDNGGIIRLSALVRAPRRRRTHHATRHARTQYRRQSVGAEMANGYPWAT